MIKIKLLFVVESLNIGGVEKSLIALLNSLDYSRFDVSLKVLRNGLFLKVFLPSEVKLLISDDVFLPFFKFLYLKLMSFRFIDIFVRLLSFIFYLFFKNTPLAYFEWNLTKLLIKNENAFFNIVIAYGDGLPVYYVTDKVLNFNSRFLWNHTHYESSYLNKKMDKLFYSKANLIITPSNLCQNSLIKVFPFVVNKTHVIDNIILVNQKFTFNGKNIIINKSSFEDSNKEIKIISVGRLNYEKNYFLALEAISKLILNNFNIHYYIIGTGPEQNKIQKKINSLNLKKYVTLLGNQINPYYYISNSYILLHTSLFEAKSIVIEEAKILGIPIVVTNYKSVNDSIKDNYNGVIVDFNPDSVCQGLIKLIKDKDLRDYLIKNAKKDLKSNSRTTLNSFYKLIENEIT